MSEAPAAGLSDGEIERLVSAEVTQGWQYIYGPDNIAAERDRNYDYFRGIMRDLPAPKGRSSVVKHVVADYIGMLKPSLLRIFTAGRDIAEYVSPKPELEPATRIITRFINDVVFRKDNRGELMLSDWSEDGLIQKLGVAMWWWEESYDTKDEIFEGIPDEAFPLLIQEAQARGAEIVEHTATEVMAQTPAGPIGSIVHAVKVRVRVNKSKCCVENIPPEEFVASRDARNLEDAVLKAQRTGVMVGDLIKAGYDAEVVEKLPAWTQTYQQGALKYLQDYTNDPSRTQSEDPMLKKVGIVRGILKCDRDGTGIKDWYVVLGGNDNALKLLEIQPYTHQIGFADFCPEPLPHTIYGRCPADRLSEIQRVETVLVRQMLDSLYLSNTPQREVVMDSVVKPDQLMNMAPGAWVGVKQAGAIREISIPFVGEHALKGLAYFEAEAELTTGVGRNTAGLDPEALAGQSATAAANMYSAMQSRVEQIARTWAQGGMRKLFRGILNCLKEYQDFARVVQIEGKSHTLTPEMFQQLEDIEVNIQTGFGAGNRGQEVAMLTAVQADQEKVIEFLGPNNPIVPIAKLVRTMQMKAEAAGEAFPENMFTTPPANFQVPPPPEPKPSPDVVVHSQALVEIERIKSQAKLNSDDAERRMKYALEVRKQDIDAAIEAEKNGINRASVLVDAAKVDLEAKKIDAKEKAA